MKERFDAVLFNFEGKEYELIPVLQKVQAEFGYLPEELLGGIAKFLHIPESNVYAVATFYAQFRFTPIGKKHVMVCRGTACHVKGAPKVQEDIEGILKIKEGETTKDMEYSLESVACIGACSLAPCIMINNKVEANMNKDKSLKIFSANGQEKML